jgi:hypothetical protein
MEQRPSTPTKRSLLVFLGFCLAQQVTSQNPEVNQRTIDCMGSDPPLVGYDRIIDIVNDQFEEFQRIENGDAPRPPYIFRLCPNTDFDTGQQTLPLILDGAVITCGPNMASSDNCVFRGGNVQIVIEDSIIEGYPLSTVSLIGITFEEFSPASVNAYAGAGTTAMFIDCVWQNFQSNSILTLGTQGGLPDGERMRVEISGGSMISNGNGASYFSNDAGTLIFDDVQFGEPINGIVSRGEVVIYFGIS